MSRGPCGLTSIPGRIARDLQRRRGSPPPRRRHAPNRASASSAASRPRTAKSNFCKLPAWSCTRTGARFIICGAPLFRNPASRSGYYERVRERARVCQWSFPAGRMMLDAVLAQSGHAGGSSLREPRCTPRHSRSLRRARARCRFRLRRHPRNRQHRRGNRIPRGASHRGSARRETGAHCFKSHERLRKVAANAYETWKEKFTLERYQREVLAVIGLTQTLSATGRSS